MTTPLNANSTSSLLQNTGLNINPVAASYMGASSTNSSYTPGITVNNTCLYLLTYAIYEAYNNGNLTSGGYDDLISIGSGTIPALGNSKPPTYIINDPTGIWSGEATSGYAISGNTGQGQSATWIPYNTTNTNVSVTQWGFIRCFALQAQNEFNFNNTSGSNPVRYQDFVASFLSCISFLKQTNTYVNVFANGPEYLDGVYSNMDDLISSDIAGITLSTKDFGQDCITLGKALDLTKISSFGLPSVLLQTLKKYNAITQSLSLALLSSGLSVVEIENILQGQPASNDQEQKIYGAFLIIVGQDLINILVPLNCKTRGLESLADLLNVKKIFPNSYRSLTVPLYNLYPSANNSKTYYLIYDGNNVSSSINTPAVKAKVGTLSVPGQPAIQPSNGLDNIQVLPTGFDSYLVNILPTDVALAAGAFGYAVQQVKNIQLVDFEKFSQVVFNIETVKNLNLVNGSNVPVNTTLMNQGISLIGLGTGPNRSFTVSDFFGCMSGLPYNWSKLTSLIQTTQTTKLSNIYNQLYLSVTWEAATLSFTILEYSPGNWRMETLSISNSGGGYGRGTAVAPSITLPNGATATCTIGTDPTNVATYGKVLSVSLTNKGTSASSSGWYAYIQAPPTATLAVQTNGNVSTSGVNTVYSTVGWPSPMQTVVSDYVTQANTEISSINSTNTINVQNLKSLYEQFGTQLMIEQRARYIAVAPVPVPRDSRLNPYPVMIFSFIESLPEFSKNTLPHMESQTIEAISNLNTVGGQSVPASLREARNLARLQLIGVPGDSNVPDGLDQNGEKELLCNGAVNYTINGTTYTTTPSTLNQDIDNVTYTSIPDGQLLMPGSPLPNQNAYNNSTPGPASSFGPDGQLSVPGSPLSNQNPYNINVPVIQAIEAPVYLLNSGVPLDTGQAAYPSSFAGSPVSNIVPITLNTTYASGTTLPSTYTVPEAIDQVIHCNCDCWI